MSKFCMKIQDDAAGSAKRCTLSIEDYKKVFIVVNESERTVALKAYDTVKEYEAMIGAEPGSCAGMDSIGRGEQIKLAEGLCTRVW